MSDPVVHGSFSVERTFPVPPARVFAAFANPDLKSAWFRGPDGWEPSTRVLDFHEGGRETTAGEVPGEWSSRFEATYHVIEADSQIVYSYVMFHNDVRLSVSVATIELDPLDGGARPASCSRSRARTSRVARPPTRIAKRARSRCWSRSRRRSDHCPVQLTRRRAGARRSWTGGPARMPRRMHSPASRPAASRARSMSHCSLGVGAARRADRIWSAPPRSRAARSPFPARRRRGRQPFERDRDGTWMGHRARVRVALAMPRRRAGGIAAGFGDEPEHRGRGGESAGHVQRARFAASERAGEPRRPRRDTARAPRARPAPRRRADPVAGGDCRARRVPAPARARPRARPRGSTRSAGAAPLRRGRRPGRRVRRAARSAPPRSGTCATRSRCRVPRGAALARSRHRRASRRARRPGRCRWPS